MSRLRELREGIVLKGGLMALVVLLSFTLGAYFAVSVRAVVYAGLSLRENSVGCLVQAFGLGRRMSLMESETQRQLARARLLRSDDPGFQLWDTDQGHFWLTANAGIRLLAPSLADQKLNLYGEGEWGVRPGDVVLDCGAAFGVFTKKALQSGARLVVAVEPQPELVECLRRTFSKDIDQRRVIVWPTGVWDREDQLELTVPENTPTGGTLVLGREGLVRNRSVRLMPIDRLVGELNLPRVDFIKMDIEGAEKKALAGAAGTLRKHRPRLAICSYHLPEDPVLIPKRVRELQASYRVKCGRCELDLNRRRFTPTVLHFY
jgi:FkbM family methyltransferase